LGGNWPSRGAGQALAVGSKGSTFADHGLGLDNSGKNGHYAPIRWSY